MQPRRVKWLAVTGGFALVALVVAAGVYWKQSNLGRQQAAAYQNAMRLTELDGTPAPDFTLTDQHGKRISLSDLKGKVIVLEFMDPECTDICPVVSQEIVDANKHLGPKAADVEYLAVNVNQYHEAQQDILKFSQEHGLDRLPNWHFLTGNTSELQAVWKAYGIEVVPNPTGDVEHSSFMYFIDRQGKERYLANPDNSTASIPEWGKGIAWFAGRLTS
ncbi:MAG: SCO family protein [Alicyclobacillus sp.]|nr:SCO family protein [Alicyclobacillus sp.]